MRLLVAAIAAIIVGSLPTKRLMGAAAIGAAASWASVLTLAADVAKGLLVTGWIAGSGPWAQTICATAVVAAHQWPLFGAERGHRGTAVALGALTAVTPIAAPLWAVLWGLGFVASGYAAAGFAAGAVLLPVALGFLAGWPMALMALPVCVLLGERLRQPLREALAGRAPKHHWRGWS
jgi:glycerol-3-phosphate acyltransferase PlsY